MTNDSRDTLRQVKQYILKNFLFTEDEMALANNQSLMQSGAIDSTGVLELINFLEEAFGLRISDDEMLPENFDSIDSIAAFVTRKSQDA